MLSSPTDLNKLESDSLLHIWDAAMARIVIYGSELDSGREGMAVQVIHAVGDRLHQMGSRTLASTTIGN